MHKALGVSFTLIIISICAQSLRDLSIAPNFLTFLERVLENCLLGLFPQASVTTFLAQTNICTEAHSSLISGV